VRPRRVGIAGLAFCGFLIAALVLPNPPEADQADSAILSYYADSGKRHREFLSAVLFGIAVVAFLVFLTGLHQLLDRVEVGEPSPLPELAFVGGLAFALLWSVGWAIATAIPATLEFTDEFKPPDPNTARLVRHLGAWWLPSLAAMIATLLVGATSLLARRTRLLPVWLTWIGFVVTVVLLFSLPLQFFGPLVVALWVLVTSVILVLGKTVMERRA
jgi:hypothetical protein